MNRFPVPFKIIATVTLTFVVVTIGVFNLRDRAGWVYPFDGIFWVETDRGLRADQVFKEGSGAVAGIRPGDLLISINGQEIANLGQYDDMLYRIGVNGSATYRILTEGVAADVSIQIGARVLLEAKDGLRALLAFLHLGPPQGRRVAIVGTGGGISVGAADAFGREGLEVPTLTPETWRELRGFVPPAGNSIRNPLDIEVVFGDISLLERALDVVTADPLVDLVILSLHLDWLYDMSQGGHIAKLATYLAGSARDHMQDKPYVVSWRCYRPDPGLEQAKAALQQELVRAGVPVYHGIPRAARALAKLAEYHRFHKEGCP